jgi:GGDEF domain-containing protein
MCAIAEPIALHDRVVCITGSIGIALPRATTPLSALLDEADRALYDAKAAGKACVRLSTDATRHDPVPVQRAEPLAPVGRP